MFMSPFPKKLNPIAATGLGEMVEFKFIFEFHNIAGYIPQMFHLIAREYNKIVRCIIIIIST